MKNVKKDKDGKIISFTISRKTWLRGNGEISALLWTKDSYKLANPFSSPPIGADIKLNRKCVGKSCCLGHATIACGVPKKVIKNVATPRDLEYEDDVAFEKVKNGFPWLFFQNVHREDDVMFEAMTINDDGLITDKIREKKLKELFKKNGCVVKFVP